MCAREHELPARAQVEPPNERATALFDVLARALARGGRGPAVFVRIVQELVEPSDERGELVLSVRHVRTATQLVLHPACS